MATDTVRLPARSMYYGTVVALVTTVNADGSDNLTPISSVWPCEDYLCLGIGSASQTAENLRVRPQLALNLPSTHMWTNVEALSRLTGQANVPAHKRPHFQFSPDKFDASLLTREPAHHPGPSRVSGCPLQIEARVDALHEIPDPDEGFLVVLARVVRAYADERILVQGRPVISPHAWKPLIFSFRSYRADSTYPLGENSST